MTCYHLPTATSSKINWSVHLQMESQNSVPGVGKHLEGVSQSSLLAQKFYTLYLTHPHFKVYFLGSQNSAGPAMLPQNQSQGEGSPTLTAEL